MRKSILPVWSEISQLKNLQWGDPYCLYVYHFAPGSTDVLIGSFWFFFIFLVLFEEKRYPSWGILYEEIHIICMMIISRDFEVFRNILDEESSMRGYPHCLYVNYFALGSTVVLFGSLFLSFWFFLKRREKRYRSRYIPVEESPMRIYPHCLYVNYFAPGSTVSPQC